MAKRYTGNIALVKYEKIVNGDHANYEEADAFIMGDAEITTAYGTFATQIAEIDGMNFDGAENGPMCVSAHIDIGAFEDDNVTMRIAAPLRYWTLVNR